MAASPPSLAVRRHGTDAPARPSRLLRIGFVVLHPPAGVAGAPVTIEDVEGSVTPGRFHDPIGPARPMMNLRTLTHAAARRLPHGLPYRH